MKNSYFAVEAGGTSVEAGVSVEAGIDSVLAGIDSVEAGVVAVVFASSPLLQAAKEAAITNT
jgi:hypothetical protein